MITDALGQPITDENGSPILDENGASSGQDLVQVIVGETFRSMTTLTCARMMTRVPLERMGPREVRLRARTMVRRAADALRARTVASTARGLIKVVGERFHFATVAEMALGRVRVVTERLEGREGLFRYLVEILQAIDSLLVAAIRVFTPVEAESVETKPAIEAAVDIVEE